MIQILWWRLVIRLLVTGHRLRLVNDRESLNFSWKPLAKGIDSFFISSLKKLNLETSNLGDTSLLVWSNHVVQKCHFSGHRFRSHIFLALLFRLFFDHNRPILDTFISLSNTMFGNYSTMSKSFFLISLNSCQTLTTFMLQPKIHLERSWAAILHPEECATPCYLGHIEGFFFNWNSE